MWFFYRDHGVALLEISEEIRRKNSQQWIQQVEQVARRLVGIITDQQRQTYSFNLIQFIFIIN